MLAGLQQLSGITPVFSFLPEIFRAAGTAPSDAFFQSVLVSLINLVFTLFALWLVDKAGRKTLVLAGTTVQFISFALVGWFYHIHGSGVAVLIFVMSFVAGHAFGNGVACWVIISEIYPTKVRGRGMSIAITALWVVGYLGNQMFPSCKTSGLRRHFLVLQRRRVADDHSGRLADSRNQRPLARRDHQIVDGR